MPASEVGQCRKKMWHHIQASYTHSFYHSENARNATNLSEVQADRLVNKWQIKLWFLFIFYFLISNTWPNLQKQFRPVPALANYLGMNQVQICHAFKCIPFCANPTPFSRFQWTAWSFAHSCCGEIGSRLRLQASLLHSHCHILRKYSQAREFYTTPTRLGRKERNQIS